MRDNAKRRADRARRKQLFERLRLQAELLCESYKQEHKSTIILSRMMMIILEIVGRRSLNSAKKQALADHLADSTATGEPSIQLGGGEDRDIISISGHFSFNDLAKRIAWSEARGGQTIEVDHASQ